MTPLILRELHNKYVKDSADGRPAPRAQIIVNVMPNGLIVADFAGVPNRQVANMIMVTAHQDIVRAFQNAEQADPGIAVVTDQQSIATLNGSSILVPPKSKG
jgi:hypothetical protein